MKYSHVISLTSIYSNYTFPILFLPVLMTSYICWAVRSLNDITMYPSPANILFILRSSISAYVLGSILEPLSDLKLPLLITTAIPRTSWRKLYSLWSCTSFLFNFMHFCNFFCKNLRRNQFRTQINFEKKNLKCLDVKKNIF